MQRWLIAEEANQVLVAEAEELDLLMVLTRIRVPLGVEDGVQREGRIPLHDVGELEAWGELRVRKGPAALRTVSGAVLLLSAPVLSDALPAEVMLAAETHGVLVDAQADRTQQLILQTTSHLQMMGPRSIQRFS